MCSLDFNVGNNCRGVVPDIVSYWWVLFSLNGCLVLSQWKRLCSDLKHQGGLVPKGDLHLLRGRGKRKDYLGIGLQMGDELEGGRSAIRINQ